MIQSRELVTEHIWSHVNLHCFGLPKTWYFMRVYINVVPTVIYKRKRMKMELVKFNGGPAVEKVGCPMRRVLLCCDIS